MNGRCRVLGQKCLTFRSELKDAVLQFPEVLAVYWVKGIRCSTGNEKHQIVLPFSSEALPLIVRATRAAIRCIVPEVQQCGLDCHSRNGRRWPQAAQLSHSCKAQRRGCCEREGLPQSGHSTLTDLPWQCCTSLKRQRSAEAGFPLQRDIAACLRVNASPKVTSAPGAGKYIQKRILLNA